MLCASNKGVSPTDLINELSPSSVRIDPLHGNTFRGIKRVQFNSKMVKDLIEQSNLCNADSDADIQSLNVKTMVLKIING